MRHRATRLFAPASFLVSMTMQTTPVAGQWPPDTLRNLRVLPSDIRVDSLVSLMAGFTRALGVRCTHCHLGQETQPLAEYDFVSDDKATKRMARAMLRMVEQINLEHLAGLESRSEPAVRVECFTCHRGAREPRTLQSVLLLAYDAGGADSAIAAYRVLREREYGRAVFDFGEVALADVATAVASRDQHADAERLAALNVEMNAKSAFAKRQHGSFALGIAFRAGPAAGRARYEELLGRYGNSVLVQPLLHQIGRALLARNEHGPALALFQLVVERYPDSWNAHDALADVYAASGNVAEAIQEYERALALDPANATVLEKLRRLRGRQEADAAGSPPDESSR